MRIPLLLPAFTAALMPKTEMKSKTIQQVSRGKEARIKSESG
jgi:hypothetical protein